MKKLIVTLVALVLAVVFSGCATMRPNNRPAEVGQKEYAQVGYRSGASVLLVNERTCTNVDWYLYAGRRGTEELLPNINGKHYVQKGYLDHGWMMNAFNYQNPTKDEKLLNVGSCYTILRIVHWGIAGDYSLDSYSFCTTSNAVQMRYQDGFGRVYYANQIILMPGSDTPAMNRLDLNLTLHPGAAVKGFLNGLMGR